MPPLLRRALRWFAYAGAALIILLAVAVGLFRLLLPQLPEYQAEIQARVSAAAGIDIKFGRLDARWRFSGPELLFEEIVLSNPVTRETLLSADEAVVGLSLTTLVLEQQLRVHRIVVRDAALSVERDSDGVLLLEGRSLDDWALPRRNDSEARATADEVLVRVEDIEINYRDAAARREISTFTVAWAEYQQLDGGRSISVELAPPLGAPVTVSANRRVVGDDPVWSVYLASEDAALAHYLGALPASLAVPVSGRGLVNLWMDWRGGALVRANANFDLNAVAVPLGPAADEFAEAALEGQVEWVRDATDVVAGFDLERIEIDGSAWQPTRGQLDAAFATDGSLSTLALKTGFLNLGQLTSFYRWLPEPWSGRVGEWQPDGAVRRLGLTLSPRDDESFDYRLDAEFEDLGVAATGSLPGVRGLSGEVGAESGSGRLLLDMDEFEVTAPDIFAAPLQFRRARGGVTWRSGTRGLAVLSDALQLESAAFDTTSDFEILVPPGDASPQVDLDVAFTVAALEEIPAYLPSGRMGPLLVRWFREALLGGRVDGGTLTLSGPLAAFPFRDGEGRFEVAADVRDATLRYANPWPVIDIERADVRMDGLKLHTRDNVASTLGVRASNTTVEMPDVVRGDLKVRAAARGDMGSGLTFVRQSPLAGLLGERVVNDLTGSGDLDVELDLFYPIRDRDRFRVEVGIAASDATLGLSTLRQSLTKLSGRATIGRETLSSDNLSGELLGAPVSIELLPAAPDTGYRAQAIVSGELRSAALEAEFDTPLLGAVDGAAPYRATVRFPGQGNAEPVPLTIRLDTDLDGMAVALPAPLTKPAAVAQATRLDVRFPEDGVIEVGGRYGERTGWLLIFNRDEAGWQLTRGNVRAGLARPVLPVGRGLFLDGVVDTVRVGDWLDYVAGLELPPGDEPLLRGMDMTAAEAFGFGQRVEQVAVKLDRNPSDWLIQLDSERVAGAVFVPLDLSGSRPLVMQMERLRLVEADPEAGESGDPRELPPLSIRADDFQLGERRFGSLEIDIQETPNGVAAPTFFTSAPSFTVAGSAAWEVSDGGEERTRLNAALTSTDAAATSAALAIDSGIEAERASAGIEVSWQGAPRKDFFASLDGEFSVLIENGKLDEVDPGAGRVLGLMSVLELPRRLALDFRDVFGKGLSFNEIDGDYRIVNGEAFTCNLSLEGPAAEIALIGRAGLDRRDYNQTAVVSANVGNSLPAVGAVVGGPQVAAAMLVLSRIFKKPLQEVGQMYYQITGSWDEPSIERTTVERFYATSQLADCLRTDN